MKICHVLDIKIEPFGLRKAFEESDLAIANVSKAPYTLEINFKIPFRNENFEKFSFESKHFHTGNKLLKAIYDASYQCL